MSLKSIWAGSPFGHERPLKVRLALAKELAQRAYAFEMESIAFRRAIDEATGADEPSPENARRLRICDALDQRAAEMWLQVDATRDGD